MELSSAHGKVIGKIPGGEAGVVIASWIYGQGSQQSMEKTVHNNPMK